MARLELVRPSVVRTLTSPQVALRTPEWYGGDLGPVQRPVGVDGQIADGAEGDVAPEQDVPGVLARARRPRRW